MVDCQSLKIMVKLMVLTKVVYLIINNAAEIFYDYLSSFREIIAFFFLNRSKIRKPIAPPQSMLNQGLEVIAHLPVRQPMK